MKTAYDCMLTLALLLWRPVRVRDLFDDYAPTRDTSCWVLGRGEVLT
jgi:hypothetical protein